MPTEGRTLSDARKLLEQGPESQRASDLGSGGVSAVIGASDLDEHSVGVPGDKGNQCNRALLLVSV